jgi:uncharacterized protein (TIGR02145 family)
MKSRFMMCALAVAVAFGGTAVTAQSVGTFTDKRDGKTYRTVKIGKQTWMAENLNYQTNGSWCNDDNPSNCSKYGRLYRLGAAEEACPVGWHLPTDIEWNELITFAGGEETAGAKLKSRSPRWDGQDAYGFSALPGGFQYVEGGFDPPGSNGRWWADPKKSYDDNHRSMGTGRTSVYDGFSDEGNSVRCVKD